MEWELDDRASPAVPLYSRAVVGDLCPHPVTPMAATLGAAAEMGPAWAAMYAEVGLCPGPGQAGPGASPDPSPVAVFGGHLFLNTSLLRLFGVHAAGADPTAFVRQFLGERPEVPRQRREPPALDGAPDRLEHWTRPVLTGRPDRAEHAALARRVGQLRAARPELASRTDGELVARVTAVAVPLGRALRLHARAELATALACELLTRTAEEAGHPARTGELAAGVGGGFGPGERAGDPTVLPWRLGRQVPGSDRLGRLFDQGVVHTATQLDRSGTAEVSVLREGLQRLLAEHGHRGPGGWEPAAPCWEVDSRLPLGLVDALRHCPDEHDPAVRVRRRAMAGAAAVEAVRASVDPRPAARDRFAEALDATRRWLRVRRQLADLVSMVQHEQRLAARELGRRQVTLGRLDEVEQVFMLLGGELEEFLAAPDRLAELLRMRSYDYHALAGYRPPLVTVGRPPSVVRWPRPAARAAAGRRAITGTGAAGGTASGPVHVSRPDPVPGGPRPGDVLVLPCGGPGWVPLLVAVSAVVVDGGAPLSEVAVASRDLGIPCVVACVDAGERLVPGLEVTVDGSLGTVRPSAAPVGTGPGVADVVAAVPAPGVEPEVEPA